MNTKAGEVLLKGPGLDGKPYAMRRGAVTVLHFFHDPDCPGCKGRPDLCCCKPDVRLGPLTPDILTGKGAA